MKRHIKNESCRKYESHVTFEVFEEYAEWKKKMPQYFAKKFSKKYKKHTTEIYRCNNRRINPTYKCKAPNYSTFIKSKISSCKGKFKVMIWDSGKVSIASKKCTNSQHITPNKISPSVKKSIVEMLSWGFTNSQVRSHILKETKTFVSRYTINNMRYHHKIRMEYKTNDCDLRSTEKFFENFYNCETNIKEITNISDLVAVFQTRTMYDLWEKDATLCIDSTHKITK